MPATPYLIVIETATMRHSSENFLAYPSGEPNTNAPFGLAGLVSLRSKIMLPPRTIAEIGGEQGKYGV
jgi:hypothetical protein